jgi:hypothetical protein
LIHCLFLSILALLAPSRHARALWRDWAEGLPRASSLLRQEHLSDRLTRYTVYKLTQSIWIKGILQRNIVDPRHRGLGSASTEVTLGVIDPRLSSGFSPLAFLEKGVLNIEYNQRGTVRNPLMSENEERGEIAFDLQTGLGRLDVPEYDSLRVVGMAAVLAIHLKGLDEVAFEVLRKVSDYYFDIPSYALKSVLEVLAETELVKLVTEGKTIKRVIPTVPFFSNVYSLVGEYSRNEGVNEHEELVLKILGKLKDRPYNQDSLRASLGANANMMSRAIDITQQGKIPRTHRARGQNIIVSPLYFADGLEALADMAAGRGLSELGSLLNKIKAGQGWPLDLIMSSSAIGGVSISDEEKRLLNKLTEENVLKPPSLTAAGKHYNFVFTPKPGEGRLTTSNRVVYEKAMALVSAVRKGQLLPEAYRIRMPTRILQVLKERGYIKANTEAGLQYTNLVRLRVGRLEHAGGSWYRFSLIDTPENRSALDLSIGLVTGGNLSNMETNQEARLALSKDETYVDSVIAAAGLRERSVVPVDEDTKRIFENLILGSH